MSIAWNCDLCLHYNLGFGAVVGGAAQLYVMFNLPGARGGRVTVDEISELDDELVLHVMDDSIKKLIATFKSCPHPRTMEGLLMLMMKANFLKTGMFTLCKDDNPFGAAVLYRSMIEHYLRHTYLFVRYVEEKTDSAGVEFYELADIKERFDYARSATQQADIFGKGSAKPDLESYVLELYPHYKDIERDRLQQLLSQFGVKSLIRFIWAKLGTVGLEPGMFGRFLTDYCILSSNVHGGRHADRLMLLYATSESEREDEKLKLSRQGFFLSTAIMINTFIVAGQYDRFFLRYLDTMKEYSLRPLAKKD